ncbi:MAG TPA: protein kinase [Longimicrobiales bacterium]|nr:protein kinase [Longimicrobiales bacterium]
MTNDRRLPDGFSDRYRILGEIGAGGMATVYRARDLRHDRDVALKVLPSELAARLGTERFLAEIRVTARLHHPHILALFDSGEAEGLPFYVTPYVTGETLRQRLDREGRLTVEEALRITYALAGALDHAHRQGVLHRDLKPENVLFQDDTPLLADFGIARAFTIAGGERLTATGVFIGTPLYASPEQVAGEREPGPPADIYSLAAMLYEMLTGEPPFTGKSVEAVLARVLTEAPRSIRTVQPTVPVRVEAAILKALAKLPADRYASVAEFVRALTDGRATAPDPAGNRARKPILAIAAALLVLAAAIGVTVYSLRGAGADTARAAIRQLTFTGRSMVPAIAPAGDFLAYVLSGDTAAHVMVQDVAGGPADTVLTVTGVWFLEWSPDGRRLLVSGWDSETGPGLIALVSRSGGQPRYLAREYTEADGPAGTARWVTNNRISILQPKRNRMLVFDLAGGDTTVLAMSDGILGYDWSPDGERFAVEAEQSDSVFEIRVVAPGGSEAVVVQDRVRIASPRWSASGDRIYYTRGDEVWRVQISRRTGRNRADPVPVQTGLEALTGDISISDDGRLVYAKGRRHSNLVVLESVGANAGRVLPLTTGTALRGGAALSPDERWIAFVEVTGTVGDIHQVPIDGGPARRITFAGNLRVPNYTTLAWSPGGDSIVYSAGRFGLGIVAVRSGAVTQVPHLPAGFVAWAPDRMITYLSEHQSEIRRFDPTSGDDDLLIRGGFESDYFWGPAVAPDGQRLAVLWIGPKTSDNTGIWIIDLNDGSRTRLTTTLGMFPRAWSFDSRYIYLQRYNRGAEAFRIDTHDVLPTEAEVFLRTPFREADCIPAGHRRPSAHVCTEYGFVSDIVMIEDFDASAPGRRAVTAALLR